MMMDITAMIDKLETERRRLDGAIEALRRLQQQTGSPRAASSSRQRRGRKFMSAAERREVSARMKRYWAKRRKQAA
jgi:hypothetical protein